MLSHPRKKCQKCKNLALYGYSKQIYCEDHKEAGMYNLVERPCQGTPAGVKCASIDVLDENNLCQSCGEFIIKRVHLAKQNEVKEFFDVNGIVYASCDRMIDRNCGRERPDFVFDALSHKIVVEVDENQHGSYEKRCEYARMINLSQNFGMPVIFIRYNPDPYKNHLGKRVKTSQKARLNTLRNWLDHCMTLSPKSSKEFIRVIYLYFNGYQEGHVSIETVDPTEYIEK